MKFNDVLFKVKLNFLSMCFRDYFTSQENKVVIYLAFKRRKQEYAPVKNSEFMHARRLHFNCKIKRL